MAIIYLRTHMRRPIWVGRRPVLYDEQGQIPYGWCESCGMECYEEGVTLCPECERMKKDGETNGISL